MSNLKQCRGEVSDPNWELLRRFMRAEDFDPAVSTWLNIESESASLIEAGGVCFRQAVSCNLPQRPFQWKIPYRSNDFDLVTAVGVFDGAPEHHQLDLMVEISRVLRPEGTACIIGRNPLNPGNFTRSGLQTAGNIATLLRNSGLIAPKVAYFNHVPPRAAKIVRFAEAILARIPAGRNYAVFAHKHVPAILKSRATVRGYSGRINFFSYGTICAT